MPDLKPIRFRDGLVVEGWTLVTGGQLGRDVWAVEAEDETQGVIKRPRGSAAPWPSRFAHEVNVMQSLHDDSGVLRVLDRDPDEPPRWFVTERAIELIEHVGVEPDFRTVVETFAQLADTLATAAEEGIAHRDIKPSNLFYARGGAVLGDFGLATGHLYKGLTREGTRVGPSNFAAPETLQWKRDTDPFPADVFSLAKSLWAVAAERTYPPQGQLLIRLWDVDLAQFGGPPAQDLGRLLEIATNTTPNVRPSMATMRDELGNWLKHYPTGSTPRPESSKFRRGFDVFMSGVEVERKGLTAVVDSVVQRLLNECRPLREGSSRLILAPDAKDPHLDDLGRDDEGWEPDQVITKKLQWADLPGIRLVATATLEGDDDLRYDVSWQKRDSGTFAWRVVWRNHGRSRMRLPSDLAERARLLRTVEDNAPSELTEVGASPPEEVALALRRVAQAAESRESAWFAAESAATARSTAGADALTLLDEFWGRLSDAASTVVHDVGTARGHGAWILTLRDRRLVVTTGEPTESSGDVVQLGTVTVETQEGSRSDPANLCALLDSEGVPVWNLVRMQRNDLALNRVRVTEARSDGLGSVTLRNLERVLEERSRKVSATSATVHSLQELSVADLLTLFAAEAEAI